MGEEKTKKESASKEKSRQHLGDILETLAVDTSWNL